ncbi:hypothetical protein UA74_15955 [Actinoalloteichus fjordicus]|uniref:Uncharacterized protein n=2 Tax=Actinoalloteichus fjordicus TaxID=1612552 RepID=A0AAC9LCS8_9PSEU|nr:hypothetical protein UA74_15955 [Actinoalloteichus fjordicus]
MLGHLALVPHRDDQLTQHAATRRVMADLGDASPAPIMVEAYNEILEPYYHSLWCPRAILMALDQTPDGAPYPMSPQAAAKRLVAQRRQDRRSGARHAVGDDERELTPMERVVLKRLGRWNRSKPPREGFRDAEELAEALNRRSIDQADLLKPAAAASTRDAVLEPFRRPTRADAVRRVRESQDRTRRALASLGSPHLPPPVPKPRAEKLRRAWQDAQDKRAAYHLETDTSAAELLAVQALRQHRADVAAGWVLQDDAVSADLTEAARQALLRHHHQRRRASPFRASMDALDAYLNADGDDHL